MGMKDMLQRMDVDVIEPESRKEESMAQALDAFSNFVLVEEKEKCKAILESHMGRTVGGLQGGSEAEEVYRVVIDDDENEACMKLLKEFGSCREGKKYCNLLTAEKFEEYMLGMCHKCSRTHHSAEYSRVNNLMFILTFGTTVGQVRHIDKMDPNLQICLYMSRDCPSTIVYSLGGPEITNHNELIELWETKQTVPQLVKDILNANADEQLKSKQFKYLKYFSFWGTINATLECFGKLYRPVSSQLSFEAEPGATLVAGGNEVHAGPPTTGPRMFAFAVGIPEDERSDGGEDNDGEVQYCVVRLHVDLSCILFTMMDFEYEDRLEEHEEAKRFLIDLLFSLVKEYPKETYERLLGDDRSDLRDWLGRLVRALGDEGEVHSLLQAAAESDSMFYAPEAGRKSKMRRSAKRKQKKKGASSKV